MGKAILISWAGQEFSNSMEDSVLSSRCRNNLRSTKHMEVVVGGMSKKGLDLVLLIVVTYGLRILNVLSVLRC